MGLFEQVKLKKLYLSNFLLCHIFILELTSKSVETAATLLSTVPAL